MKCPNIHVLLPPLGYANDIKLGISEFRDRSTNWILIDCASHLEPNTSLPMDGAIIFALNTRLVEAWQAIDVPIVNLSMSLESTPFVSISVDNFRVGELAAQHFLDRNFKNFAYLGPNYLYHSVCREKGFYETISGRAETYEVYTPPEMKSGKLYLNFADQGLRNWLKQLRTPCALFCSDDPTANLILKLTMEMGFEVPAQFAILGVNNQEILCSFATKPLSSVIINGREIGFTAAKALQDLLQNEKTVIFKHFIKPVGIAARKSTDIFSHQNLTVAKGLQFISTHLTEPISSSDIASHLALSKRSTERLFSQELGHGPYEEIVNQRMKRAKQMLLDTQLPIHQIAGSCGYSDYSLFPPVLNAEKTSPPRLGAIITMPEVIDLQLQPPLQSPRKTDPKNYANRCHRCVINSHKPSCTHLSIIIETLPVPNFVLPTN